MNKVTKKEQIETLQTVVAAQWRQINKLKLHLGRLVDIDWSDEQASHDEVIAILDSKEPKLKALDQSVFDGLDAKWRFAVMQHNGYVIVCDQKPFLAFGGSSWDWNGHNIGIGGGYDTTDWQNSLIERESVELTGNALCLKLLNLDRDVMCDVKDGDYRLIFAHDGEFFISHNKGERECHERVTPINNQGEPLTQSEAGL